VTCTLAGLGAWLLPARISRGAVYETLDASAGSVWTVSQAVITKLALCPQCYLRQVCMLKAVSCSEWSDLEMIRYAVEQFIFVVKTFLLKRSLTRFVYINFNSCIQGLRSYQINYVLVLFNKWQETGSILDKRKGCPKCAFTEDI
jgi:hypothetical protein